MNVFKTILLILTGMLGVVLSCKDQGDELPVPAPILSDAELFRHITQVDPFTSYTLFPAVDSIAAGTTTAHQSLVRVSLNAKAMFALQNDSLPAGSRFPDRSIIFKQIIVNGRTTLYAVIFKDSNNPLSGNGWLWAEFDPNGTAFISLTRKGVNCTPCHSLEQGMRHDFVRTFERQR